LFSPNRRRILIMPNPRMSVRIQQIHPKWVVRLGRWLLVKVSRLFTLQPIQPIDGQCDCKDTSRVNATCGFHSVLIFMVDQLGGSQNPRTEAQVRDVN
jgi:hypothetical protein